MTFKRGCVRTDSSSDVVKNVYLTKAYKQALFSHFNMQTPKQNNLMTQLNLLLFMPTCLIKGKFVKALSIKG